MATYGSYTVILTMTIPGLNTVRIGLWGGGGGWGVGG